MGALLFYLWIYVIGGITFIPLTAIAVLSVLYLWLPKYEEATASAVREEGEAGTGTGTATRTGPKTELDVYSEAHPEIKYEDLNAGEFDEKTNSGVDTYATGWLTVTTEFYQLSQYHSQKDGNAAGTTHHDPNEMDDAASTADDDKPRSPSAYSQFYKFVKGDKNSAGTRDNPESDTGKSLKNVRKKNRYFAVLKHGNLFLYKDDTCRNVQHVIVLNNTVVTVWPRTLKEGELFSKRAAICLMKKSAGSNAGGSAGSAGGAGGTGASAIDILTSGHVTADLEPPKDSFFVYTDYNHEKEDWYFNLIRATKRNYLRKNAREDLVEPSVMAKTSFFKTRHMIELIQTLNSSEGQLTTKWLNALIGRVFLGLHNTKEFHDFVKAKVEKKLMKIKKPGFLDDFQIEKINVGDGGPFITFPKLNTLSPEGFLELEMNLLYRGGLSIQIATKANISLGARFKTREVNLVLTVKLVKLAGKLLVRVKPPPSNRIWYSFVTMPDLDLEIEPVVSARQLTYNVVHKIIGNKFKEAIRESLVMPYMDEFPIFDTEGEVFRGGIWDKKVRRQSMGSKSGRDGAPAKSETLANDELASDSLHARRARDDASSKRSSRQSFDDLKESDSLADDDDDGVESYAAAQRTQAPQAAAAPAPPAKAGTFPLASGAAAAVSDGVNAFSHLKHSNSMNSGLTSRSMKSVNESVNSRAEGSNDVLASMEDGNDAPRPVPRELIPDAVERHQPVQTQATQNVYEDQYSTDAYGKSSESEASSRLSRQVKKMFNTKNESGDDDSASVHSTNRELNLKIPDKQNISTSIKKIGKWYNKARDNRGVEQVPDEVYARERNYTPPEMIKFRKERSDSSLSQEAAVQRQVSSSRPVPPVPEATSPAEPVPAKEEQMSPVTPTSPDRSGMFRKQQEPVSLDPAAHSAHHQPHSRKPPPPRLPPRQVVSGSQEPETAAESPTPADGTITESPIMIQHRKSKSSISSPSQVPSIVFQDQTTDT